MRPTPARWLAAGDIPADLDRAAVWLLRDDEPEWGRLVAGLRPSAVDLSDAALFSSPQRSAARLARRLLLKALTGLSLGVAPDTIVVARAASGAIGIAAPLPLFASLSARDGWTMVGLGSVPVGVDVEVASPPPPLPLDMLSPADIAQLSALAPDAQPAAFARHWVAREAGLKALGVGLNRDPASLSVHFEGDRATIGLAGLDTAFARAELRAVGGMVAAAAVTI